MGSDRCLGDGLSFDDVLLVPAKSSVLPCEADLSTRLTENIRLRLPFLSAAMDTVTEITMAVEIARLGGIGIIHKNLSVEAQTKMVARVKRYEAGVVESPTCLTAYTHTDGPTLTVKDVKQLSTKLGYSSFPVINEDERFLGLVYGDSLKYEDDSTPINKVMTPASAVLTLRRDKCPSPAHEPGSEKWISPTFRHTPQRVKALMCEHKVNKLVVLDDEDHVTGLICFSDFIKAATQPDASKDEFGRLRVGAAIGIDPVLKDAASDPAAPGGQFAGAALLSNQGPNMRRARSLVEAGVDILCVDSSHGHSQGVLDFVRVVRQAFPTVPIIAGNVTTAQGAIDLAEAGADVVKCGVGPGSICTTRIVTGCGVPQFSAILQCRAGIDQFLRMHPERFVTLIADGGIKFSGDFVKALAAGADAVMCGSVFAGTEEAPGQFEFHEGKAYKYYRGMGSIAAMSAGSADRYFQKADPPSPKSECDEKPVSKPGPHKLVPEGVEARVPFKGRLAEVVAMQVGGIRSGMGLTGCKCLEALREVKYMKITAAGSRESHPHSVEVSKSVPNYAP